MEYPLIPGTTPPSSTPLDDMNLNSSHFAFPLLTPTPTAAQPDTLNTTAASMTTNPFPNANNSNNNNVDLGSLDEMLGVNAAALGRPSPYPAPPTPPPHAHHHQPSPHMNMNMNMNVNMGVTHPNTQLGAILDQTALPLNPVFNPAPPLNNPSHHPLSNNAYANEQPKVGCAQPQLVSSCMPPLPVAPATQGAVSRKRRHAETATSETTSSSTTTTNSTAAGVGGVGMVSGKKPPTTPSHSNNNSNSNSTSNASNGAPLPAGLPTKDDLVIDQAMLLQIGGLSYAELYKERAREAFKEAKKNEYLANGNFDRMKRRKKNDTSMSAKEKYQRRLRMNQDSAAAARHAQEIYVLVLEKLVGTCEAERKGFVSELCEIKNYNCQLKDKVFELEQKVKLLQDELSDPQPEVRDAKPQQAPPQRPGHGKDECEEQALGKGAGAAECGGNAREPPQRPSAQRPDERERQGNGEERAGADEQRACQGVNVSDDLEKKLDPILAKFLDMFKAPAAEMPEHADSGVLPAPAV